jgi:uncharacterized protein (DUF302 family)
MSYYFTTTINGGFDQAIEQVTEALKAEGFGVLTEVDVKNTFKQKLDVDFRNYRILGACNPQFAYQALQKEDKVGTMLPCNVIVQEKNGQTEVSAVDPVASMQSIDNEDLGELAQQVQAALKRVIDGL